MYKSFLLIAWRNLSKNKGYSFINIVGLSIGIACCLLMLSYVNFETSYDNFHPNGERTFRVDQMMPFRENDNIIGSTGPPLAYTLRSNYPEVEATLRINTPGDFIVRYENKLGQTMSFQEGNVFASDSTFFTFFGFPLKEGNPRTALIGINKVVISDETARKFFGDGSALGKILQFGDERRLVEVTGVTARQPVNSHFHFDYLLSMETNPTVARREWSWLWTQVVTYIRLRPGASSKDLEVKMAELGEKVIRPAFESRGMDYDYGGARKRTWNFYLRPMHDIHLKTGNNRLGPVGDIRYVYTLGIVGIFVLLIATINFVNLATARATRRAKEVGVKKTLGASRGTLISQFQSESIFLAFLATVFALLLTEGMRLMITQMAGIEIKFNLWDDPSLLIYIPFIPLIVGFLAGVYPSLYLTTFKPIQVLKGKISMGMGNSGLRNALVGIQFTISIMLIAGTMIVFQQLRFIGSTDLGFNRENILLIQYAHKLGTHLEGFRNELKTWQGVENVGIAMEVPGGGRWSDDMTREGSDVMVSMSLVKTDESYFKTLDFKLAAGRLYDETRPSDKNAVIPNEAAVRQFGWTPEEAIGKYIIYPGNESSRHEIIGVMKDSHYQSLRQAITPMMFCQLRSDLWGDWFALTIEFKPDQLSSLLSRLEQKWNATLNDTPFIYSFFDQDLAKQYESEEELGKLVGIFSSLSILIAIIGLVGLVSYTAEVRKKEIGIRKVFGASTSGIVGMINWQYVKLIFISFAISVPCSWWLMAQWLNTFAYKITISPAIFAAALSCQLLLAMGSVGFLAYRAASAKPAVVLREE